jgi:beta-glucosidase
MDLTWAIIAALTAIALALWGYARGYPRRPVAPAAYPWRERAAAQSPDAMAENILAQMRPREKLAQLSGDGGALVLLRLGINVLLYHQFPNMYAGYNRRLRIPPLSFSDGPRGVVIGRATAFPIAMARGASWDVELERRVGDALGREARAAGANYFAGICVNLLRHPAWGRAQETYGEDALHVGVMAAATVAGVQRHNVMACIKHFALNSIENSRFYVDVAIDERTLHEVFLPQFRRCIDAGAASVMSAYNRVRGDYCGHSRWLLEDILRAQWGFRGFVSSDWLWGVHDAVKGIDAGLDVEMPRARIYGRPLRRALRSGALSWERIDVCVRRVLRTKLQFSARADPEVYVPAQLACAAHTQLAQEVAEKSMVLLQNRDACLPFEGIRTLAVIGELAARANTGDHGSSRTAPPAVISVLDGMREWLGPARVRYCDGRDPQQAAQLAAAAVAALIVAGCGPEDEGENLFANRVAGAKPKVPRGGDRHTLALAPAQIGLIRAVGAAQRRSAVALIGGSAIVTDGWADAVGAVLMAWYPGMMGGRALARIVAGAVNPAGRLPFSWPSAANQLPPFDPYATTAAYGYYHGYTWFDESGQRPAYPFGFGLGYTHFAYSEMELQQCGEELRLAVTARNCGVRAGRAVVQCYGGARAAPVPRHRKRLLTFAAAELQPGECRRLVLAVPFRQLARYCAQSRRWQLDAGAYRLWLGPCADEAECLMLDCQLPARIFAEDNGTVAVD